MINNVLKRINAIFEATGTVPYTINNLTIGAVYSDFCNITENERQAFAVKNGYPSPISAIGFGYNKTIKVCQY